MIGQPRTLCLRAGLRNEPTNDTSPVSGFADAALSCDRVLLLVFPSFSQLPTPSNSASLPHRRLALPTSPPSLRKYSSPSSLHTFTVQPHATLHTTLMVSSAPGSEASPQPNGQYGEKRKAEGDPLSDKPHTRSKRNRYISIAWYGHG